MGKKTLTRADLADAVYGLGVVNRQSEPPEPISREESAALVESVLQATADALVSGETVKISSFGSFSVRQKGERVGRNPKTGEPVHISAKRTPFFKVGKELKEMVDGVPLEAVQSDSDGD